MPRPKGPAKTKVVVTEDSPVVEPKKKIEKPKKEKENSGLRSRNWVWTWNNYTDEVVEYVKTIPCKYITWGEEVGDQGTKHLQGYVEFETVKSLNTMRKLFQNRHVEIRKGNQEQAIEYCHKDGTNIVEVGTRAKQGCRTDLDIVRQMAADEGMSSVARVCNLQQIRVAEKFLTYCEPGRTCEPEVYWICGGSGLGKSTLALQYCEGQRTYTKSNSCKYWDGYDGHENVILDDFRDSWWPMTDTLRIMNGKNCQIECKGSSRQLLAKRIFFTTIKSPYEYYKGTGEDQFQLIRRISWILTLSVEENKELICTKERIDLKNKKIDFDFLIRSTNFDQKSGRVILGTCDHVSEIDRPFTSPTEFKDKLAMADQILSDAKKIADDHRRIMNPFEDDFDGSDNVEGNNLANIDPDLECELDREWPEGYVVDIREYEEDLATEWFV